MSTYRFLADATLFTHVAYTAFIVLLVPFILIGALRDWRWVRNLWLRLIHLGAMVFVGMEAALGVPCPLTVLERLLRMKGGETAYTGDFLVHWAEELLYLNLPAWAFDVGHVLCSILLVCLFIYVPPRWPRRTRSVPAPNSTPA